MLSGMQEGLEPCGDLSSQLRRQGQGVVVQENKGPKTGRKLGKCKKDEESKYKFGEGMGSKRKSQNDCEGKGKRLKSGKIFNKK